MFATAWTLAVVFALQAGAARPPTTSAAPLSAKEVKWPDDRPVIRLIPNLMRDLRSLPSSDSAIVLSAGGAGAAATRGADLRLANWSARSGDPSYTAAGRVLGDGWVQAGGAMATYAAGKLAGSAQLTHIGGDLIRAQALNGLITSAIKVSVNRTRPGGGHFAFPSGHTSATFASAATLHAHYGWKAGVPAFAAAGFVAWTRARDGAHWLSDVAFGSAIGIVSGRAVAARHTSRRVTVVPSATRGGAAVTFYIQTGQKAEGRSQK